MTEHLDGGQLSWWNTVLLSEGRGQEFFLSQISVTITRKELRVPLFQRGSYHTNLYSHKTKERLKAFFKYIGVNLGRQAREGSGMSAVGLRSYLLTFTSFWLVEISDVLV